MWPFKRKQKKRLTYKFLCKTCDIFFNKQKPSDNRCPVCGRPAEIYEVYESGSNESD